MERKKGTVLPKCKKCGFQWSWSTTVSKMFTFKRYMKCPNCSEEQYLSAKSRKRLGSVSCLFLLFGACLQVFRIPFYFLVIYFLLVVCLLPLFFEFSNEEEPLW